MVVCSKTSPSLYDGIVWELNFNPSRWSWSDSKTLLEFTAKLGRSFLSCKKILVKSIEVKWRGEVTPRFRPRWKAVWSKSRPQKDAGFIWSIYHRTVAMHCWRKIVAPNISTTCINCSANLDEMLIHRFHQCVKTCHAWWFTFSVIHRALNPPIVANRWPTFSWQ